MQQQMRREEDEFADASSVMNDESDSNVNRELKIDDRPNEPSKSETEKMKSMEHNVTSLQSSIAETATSLSDTANRVRELKADMERTKETYGAQTNQLEELTALLEKYKQENSELQEKLKESEENAKAMGEEIERLNSELLEERDNLALALEGEKAGLSRAQSLLDEMGSLKHELRLATEAEEKSKRAMDDLAMALKEVATEATQKKDKLSATEEQLLIVKEEVEKLKSMIVTSEENYKTLLSETKKENDRLKNTAERLRLEAEETLSAWNEKETELVKCIKKAEDEKNTAEEENKRLKESLAGAEAIKDKARDQNQKLRDIMKQALNEANVAKEAASIAKEENSNLKDSLAEKDKALVALAQENECLKINEAAANENIKELKRLVPSSSKKDPKPAEEKEAKKSDKEQHHKTRRLSLDLKDLILAVPGMSSRPKDSEDHDLDTDDALTDSIFDLVEPPPKAPHHRRTSSANTEDMDQAGVLEQEEVPHFDDMEIERGSQTKKRILLRRLGDLLRRKSSNNLSPKEVSI